MQMARRMIDHLQRRPTAWQCEDAYVLAEVLRSAANLERALESHVTGRKARVSWMQPARRTVAESFGWPPAVRNAALGERGQFVMQQRFSRLITAPEEIMAQ